MPHIHQARLRLSPSQVNNLPVAAIAHQGGCEQLWQATFRQTGQEEREPNGKVCGGQHWALRSASTRQGERKSPPLGSHIAGSFLSAP